MQQQRPYDQIIQWIKRERPETLREDTAHTAWLSPELDIPPAALLLKGRSAPQGLSLFCFFAGAGFLDLGFEDARFEAAFVNEYNPSFVSGYRYSRQLLGHPTPCYGISTTSVTELAGGTEGARLKDMVVQAKRSSLVGFIGGPPCPDFSVGGKNKGKDGENGRLTKTYFDLIIEHSPDWFLFENVKGLWSTKRHRAFYDENVKNLRNKGYIISDRLVNALEFGAPQDRDRVIAVGFSPTAAKLLDLRKAELEMNWENYLRYDMKELQMLPWPTTRPFGSKHTPSGDLPIELTVDYWFKKNNVDRHPNSIHRFTPRAGMSRFESVEEGDVSRKSFKRLHRGRYSPTACYGNNEVHLHPNEPRRISVAEALAIQTLPQSYQLPPTMTLSAMFKTVGNGVPYLVARGLASMIRDFITQRI